MQNLGLFVSCVCGELIQNQDRKTSCKGYQNIQNNDTLLPLLFVILQLFYTMSTVRKTIRSAREKAIAAHSLICLLQALIGEITTVELRNECYVQGQIIEVDIYMNVSMQNTSYTDQRGTRNLEAFYIRGKNIRYVQIPDHVSHIHPASFTFHVQYMQVIVSKNND